MQRAPFTGAARRVAALLAFACCGAAVAGETTSAPVPQPLPTLEQVAVQGSMPGPGMWQVRRGDHVLWLLASHAPLPRRMEWRTDEVQALVAGAGTVLAAPTVRLDADIGRMRALTLLPSLLGARKNPDGATLQDVLPPALHARWLEHKQRYLGRNRGVERWRPVFAAERLFEEALEEHGLTDRQLVWPVVEKAARRARVPITQPEVQLQVEAPREALREFRRGQLDDVRCLELTLDRIEHELPAMRTHAAAWAIGDIEALRGVPDRDQRQECIEAVLRSSVAGSRGMADLPEQARAAWLAAAEQALATHASSLAVLPLRTLLAADGYLAALAARGYEVVEPE